MASSRPRLPDPATDAGCAYILDREADGLPRSCAAPRRHGSPYCSPHHACCHIARGSAAEAARLLEIERLADTVGGRSGGRAGRPSARFLDRLEALSGDFL